MTPHSTVSIQATLRPILAALRTQEFPRKQRAAGPVVPTFITISRQAGAGGWTLARNLAARINELDPSDRPWTSWDRELVERVAADHNISSELIDALDESSHNWLSDSLGNLSFESDPSQMDEVGVYRRVAWTVRAMARAGRVILVGRGGAWLTRNMPGGVHVWLVAPLPFRVQTMARKFNLSEKDAAERVRQLDRNRDAFHRRYWPDQPPAPERFAITFSADQVSESQMVESLIPLVLPGVRCARPEPEE